MEINTKARKVRGLANVCNIKNIEDFYLEGCVITEEEGYFNISGDNDANESE